MSAFDINQLTISGNLTRDPELRHLPNGQTVCNIRIAHNHRIRQAHDTSTDQPHYFDAGTSARSLARAAELGRTPTPIETL
jgi:single-strand DNA-binding protein